MLIGYISSLDNNLDNHNDKLDTSSSSVVTEQLRSLGCEKIFAEDRSKPNDRAAFRAAIEFLRAGDVLIVTDLAQLGPDIEAIVLALKSLGCAGVHIGVGSQRFISGTPQGDTFQFVCRELAKLIKSHSPAEESGTTRRRGRPQALSAKDLARARRLLAEDAMTVADVARVLGISAATLYRYFPRRASSNST